jgi:hypothetical protein
MDLVNRCVNQLSFKIGPTLPMERCYDSCIVALEIRCNCAVNERCFQTPSRHCLLESHHLAYVLLLSYLYDGQTAALHILSNNH